MSAKTTRKESEKLEGTAKPRAPRTSTAKSAAAAKPAATSTQRFDPDGRVRAVIDRVIPEVDCGRFAV